MKNHFVMAVVMMALVLFAGSALAGGNDCGSETMVIQLQQVQVGAVASNLNIVQTNGGAGSFAGSASFQHSSALGQIVYDPVIRIDTFTFGGTVAGSKGDASATGINSGLAYGSGTLLNLNKYHYSYGR